MSRRRPDVFDQERFQEIVKSLGCPDSFVSPVTSDFRLFVPIVMRGLGEEGILELARGARAELGLGEQDPAWRVAAKYISLWAEAELRDYVGRG